jgi:hypothetical protein
MTAFATIRLSAEKQRGWGKPYACFALEDRFRLLPRFATRMRARRLPQPAAGPANGGGSEVLSVVPQGGSSEAVGSERPRVDWINRCTLVRVIRLLELDPDPKLALRTETANALRPKVGPTGCCGRHCRQATDRR